MIINQLFGFYNTLFYLTLTYYTTKIDKWKDEISKVK